MNDEQRYQQGLKVRTEVLGEKHVGRSLENLNDFNQDFQNFISRFAWGEVWSREGLPRHTRSLVTIAILLALGREDELRMHLRACFNNGVFCIVPCMPVYPLQMPQCIWQKRYSKNLE